MFEKLVWTSAITGVSAFVLVGLVRRLALRHGVLDHPGERSSHTVTTPRGGGAGLLGAALGMWIARATHPPSWAILIYVAGATLVAAIGWLDDRRGLAVRTRLAAHIVAGALVGLSAAASSQTTAIGIGIFLWWTFWTVSSINLVNFMDGINGLVACQIAVYAFSAALFPDASNQVPFYAVAVGSACIGFLPWNFPRARIFLGDVGSGGLGYLVPVLALLAMHHADVDIVRAHLPLFPLFADASFTILKRWRNGERLTVAHRSHLYQRLANGRMGHASVTMIYTLAALVGAVVAHDDSSSQAPVWTVIYMAIVIAVGFLLHRRSNGHPRVLT